MTRTLLLACGIASSLVYVAANIVGPMTWDGYSSLALSVSELSAIDAPSRPHVLPLFIAYSVFTFAFGFGVWNAGGGNRSLRISAASLVAVGVIDLAAPFFPMHLREVLAAGGKAFTDSMHIALTSVTVLFILLAMGFGAAAFGRRFRWYSITTIAVLLVFGALASLDAPGIEANLPTPWLGLWERINIGGYLLWQAALAIVVLRRERLREPVRLRQATLRNGAVSI